MIQCPDCKSTNWGDGRIHILYPHKDRFTCNDCGKKFYRYDGTEYEQVKFNEIPSVNDIIQEMKK